MPATLPPAASVDEALQRLADVGTALNEEFIERRDVIQALQNAWISEKHVFLLGPPGCLAGDTQIQVNRAGLSRSVRLDTLVAKTNGYRKLPSVIHRKDGRYQISLEGRKTKSFKTLEAAEEAQQELIDGLPYKKIDGLPYKKLWHPDIPTRIQRAQDGFVRLCNLKDAWASGFKETYLLKTQDRRSIRATAEHPFLTPDGFVRLDELSVGDKVYVNGGNPRARIAQRKDKIRYLETCVQYHPLQRSKNHGTMHVVVTHRLVMEAHLNGIDFDSFVGILRHDPDVAAQLAYLPLDQVVHHVNHNPTDNRLENLQVMSQSAHAELHAEAGNKNHLLARVETDIISSLVLAGEEMTFDLEVEDEPHNFVANGFAVHNCGKSALIERMIRRIADLPPGAYFRWLFTKFTDPNEVFGPPSLRALKEDAYVRITTGKLPEAIFAFCDEGWKGNSAILNSLLTISNERIYANGSETINVPLRNMYIASNEMPQGDELTAMYDRMHFRFNIKPLQSSSSFMKMLDLEWSEPEPIITLEDLNTLGAAANAMTIPVEVKEALRSLRDELKREGLETTERRFRECLSIIKATALMSGADTVEVEHMADLKHTLWDRAEHIPVVSRAVLALANPLDREAQDLLDLVDSIGTDIDKLLAQGDSPQAIARSAVEYFTKMKKVKKEVKTLVGKFRSSGRTGIIIGELTSRYEEVAKTLQERCFGGSEMTNLDQVGE